jgi:hypothetical protein
MTPSFRHCPPTTAAMPCTISSTTRTVRACATRFASTPGTPLNGHIMANGRAPDTSKIKQKMLYASSKDALRKKLVGIGSEIQGTDFSEGKDGVCGLGVTRACVVAYDSVLERVAGR